jgi:hypothetical protein
MLREQVPQLGGTIGEQNDGELRLPLAQRADVRFQAPPEAALHDDGRAWKTLETGTTNPLQSVIGDAQGRVFAAGLGGTILMREL